MSAVMCRIGRPLAAARNFPAVVGLHGGVDLLGPGNLLGGSCKVIGHRHQIKVGLVGAIVDIAEDVIGFDPALRLRKLVIFAELPREEVGIFAEVAVIDLHRRHVPIVPANEREVLCRRGNRQRQ